LFCSEYVDNFCDSITLYPYGNTYSSYSVCDNEVISYYKYPKDNYNCLDAPELISNYSLNVCYDNVVYNISDMYYGCSTLPTFELCIKKYYSLSCEGDVVSYNCYDNNNNCGSIYRNDYRSFYGCNKHTNKYTFLKILHVM
jgi:hypothetical protein